MRDKLIRAALMIGMFVCVYAAHGLIHSDSAFVGGAVGGCAFVLGEMLIRRPE